MLLKNKNIYCYVVVFLTFVLSYIFEQSRQFYGIYTGLTVFQRINSLDQLSVWCYIDYAFESVSLDIELLFNG